jgi:light-regulated signal transduction histidine kinase (bacteriophytochrome)
MSKAESFLTSSPLKEQAPCASEADLAQGLTACTLQLAATSRELVALGATLSHDLRAPLRSIEGFSRLLLQAPHLEQLDETGQDYLQRIHRASLRLAQMMDDMLELVRLGQTGLKSEQLDLSEMAQEILNELLASAPSRRAEIGVEPGIALTGDSRLLRLILENLLGNAWKFTRKNEVARIFVGHAIDEGLPTICVRDNGAGFDPRYADRLFRAFQRLHSMADYEGVGMGLAKAQRAVHALGGRIWARAQPGAGASFHLSLPGMTEAVATRTERAKPD